ncbi:MAG: hypothetical protein GF317_01205 [Candidatus Lokiarchaeota archaeon]|nr:hypothetical protein [Candidatus Lokiarchaeota archaeon]
MTHADMNKALIFVLSLSLTINFFLAGIIVKKNRMKPLENFPIKTFVKKCGDYDLYFIIFFSITNCIDCLKAIKHLKNLEQVFQIKVLGIIPESEKNEIGKLKYLIDTEIIIFSSRNYKKYSPVYSPCIYGVTNKGLILFKIPTYKLDTHMTLQYFFNYLENAYLHIKEITDKNKGGYNES